jgi:glycerol-3-phosphate dehydrogenase
MANRMHVVGLLEEDGRARGAHVVDTDGDQDIVVRAHTVVNATGVWADQLRPGELREEAEVPVIRPSRGTHLLVDAGKLPHTVGSIVPAGGGRTIFVLPWLGQTLVGTTDNDYEGPLEHIRPADEDVEYILEAVNAFYASSLSPSDVAGAYAGVRPLISTGDPKKSVDISRKAELYETSSGMITITGGKLTTWRRMAKMTVDRIVEREGRVAPCRTHEIPLGMAVSPDELPRVEGVPEESFVRLADRYGYAAHEVLAVAAERGELALPVLEGHPDLLAEAVFAARREQAGTVGDVLLRRTRLGLLDARALLAPGSRAVERVAAALGAERGWDPVRVEREAAAFREEASAEGLLVS